jgi:hypothetical protein
MILPAPLFTPERLHSDIQEIESVASLVCELAVPLDGVICEAFERLLELAGGRDFLPAFGALQYYLRHIQWARGGGYGGGSIVSSSLAAGAVASVPAETLATLAPMPGTTSTTVTVEESLVRLAQLKGFATGHAAWIVDPAEIIRMGLCRPRAYAPAPPSLYASSEAPLARPPPPSMAGSLPTATHPVASVAAYYASSARRMPSAGPAPSPALGEHALAYETSPGSAFSRMPPIPQLPVTSMAAPSPLILEAVPLPMGSPSVSAPSQAPARPCPGPADAATLPPLSAVSEYKKSHKKKQPSTSTRSCHPAAKKACPRAGPASKEAAHRQAPPLPPCSITLPAPTTCSSKGISAFSKPGRKPKQPGAWTRGQKFLDAMLKKSKRKEMHVPLGLSGDLGRLDAPAPMDLAPAAEPTRLGPLRMQPPSLVCPGGPGFGDAWGFIETPLSPFAFAASERARTQPPHPASS